MAARKTISVQWVRDRVDILMSTMDDEAMSSVLTRHHTDGEPLTPQQAYRLGVCSLLETILHETGNYGGFSYTQATDDGLGDETRRHYFL